MTSPAAIRGCPVVLGTLVLLGASAAPLFLRAVRAADSHHLDPNGLAGSVLLVGGADIPVDASVRFVALAGGGDARITLISNAPQQASALADHWLDLGVGNLDVVSTPTMAAADQDEWAQHLRNSSGVFWLGGQPAPLIRLYAGTRLASALAGVVERGGIVGGSAGGGAMLAAAVTGESAEADGAIPGLGILPDVLVACAGPDFAADLTRGLADSPRFGLGLDDRAAVLIRGRELEVLGDGRATLVLAASAPRGAVAETLRPGSRADLTAWRRAARTVGAAPFPPSRCQPPVVPAGSLVIVGGGRLLPPIVERFVELAGGPRARIVVLPIAMPEPLPSDERLARDFRAYHGLRVDVLRARSRRDIEAPAAHELLEQATGIWFGGGRQWRLVDAYEGTQALARMRDVLARGGVVGGTSAGASIQAEYLVRGNPLGNAAMMALGYERGFAFLPGVAVDQHFSERNRFADLELVVNRHPQLLGIGIDESTALVVRAGVGEVVGAGAVHFCDVSPTPPAARRWQRVGAGERFDLVQRQPLVP